jgi:molybdopterin-binding protein
MPRKEQGWITFQSSEEEKQILEQYCKQSQRSKTEILRELVRGLKQSPTASTIGLGEEKAGTSAKKPMKLSARNFLRGTIKKLVLAGIHAQVTLEIAPGVEIVSVITRESAEQLELVEGQEAYAAIKSSNVMIARE